MTGRWAGAIGALVVTAACATACSHGTAHDGLHPAPPAPSITVDGNAVPLRGSIPWNGALTDPLNPLVLSIDADTDRLGGLCGLPDGERVAVAEDASHVVVRVSGYGNLFKGACAGVGHAPTRLQVTLGSALGTRTLVDDFDGTAHLSRDPSTFPSLTPPVGFTPTPLTWDDREAELSREWLSAAVGGLATSVGLTVTPTADVDLHGAPDGSVLRSDIRIGPSPATVWHSVDGLNDDTTVRWPVSHGRTAQLRVISHPRSPGFDLDRVIDLAQSATVP